MAWHSLAAIDHNGSQRYTWVCSCRTEADARTQEGALRAWTEHRREELAAKV
jgi:hypothetical protein